MRELITNGVADLSGMEAWQKDSSMLVDLGELCFTELAELRHRGAFSTVAQTFAALCHQCGISKNDKARASLSSWYDVSIRK